MIIAKIVSIQKKGTYTPLIVSPRRVRAINNACVMLVLYKIAFKGAQEIYAGKPGRYYRNEAYYCEGPVITEWNRCVKNITVSSQDHANKCDLPNGTWQSSGSQRQV